MVNNGTIDFNKLEHDACGIGTVVQMDGIKSHDVVDKALTIVEKLEHRAGKDASGEVGDGVGVLLQISHKFFKKTLSYLPDEERGYGVGMFFFPQDDALRNTHKHLFATICKSEGCELLGWRKVPCKEDILGKKARDCMPYIEQAFIKKPTDLAKGFEFDQRLYVIRRAFEKSCPETYVASLSCRTIVYKGMFLVKQLRLFYEDLVDDDMDSAIAIVHSRFSTNTTPSWRRAHPNRFICHNGEINTIRGNVNRMLAREETMSSEFLDKFSEKILPVVDDSGSDSAMLDNTLEFMVMNGIDLAKAVMMTIPEPWKHAPTEENKKDFYHYYATMMEPWDGPAAVFFSDGDVVGAQLDRNGLRPARYYITDDNTLILSSEVGVLDIDPKHIVKKARLEPGKILLVDTINKKFIDDEYLKRSYATANPYGEWLSLNLLHLKDLRSTDSKEHMLSQIERNRQYRIFGYNFEDIIETIIPMAKNGIEPTGSMGVDSPLAILSKHHPSLFSYFKQLFAQVTNPPIDSLREKVVTDTTVYIGSSGNPLIEDSSNCTVLEVNNPILDRRDMDKIRRLDRPHFHSTTISLLFYRGTPLKDAIDKLFVECDRAYHNGKNIIILSDKGVDEMHLAIPSLLAVSALEQHFVKTKKKTAVSIILETGDPINVHHFATLIGYGATAIYPWLAHECIEEMVDKNMLDKDPSIAIRNYNDAIINGIVKIAAKMGISTIQSYQSAQIFEAIGISKKVIDEYFTNTISRVGGIGLKEIEEDLIYHHKIAFDPANQDEKSRLESIGKHKLISGEGKEDHLFSPKTIDKLQEACQNGDYQAFKEYSSLVNAKNHPINLRSSLDFKCDSPISIDEVESVDSIVKRFKTAAMSYGSISEEAHTCMAIAMNRLGGKSNCGEGGENPERYYSESNSAIKQVASGRFGVTSEYLVSAKEIQIKMAQGAKPGEGGHLPGNKVYPWIAKTRYSTPGVSLISPPPHHDIYSIEDLAQLIYDLKCSNRDARIGVKLVSEAGVGTIASGVAKAGAKVILISSFDGGTGAAPITSIHNAGLPWELGVSETHRSLVENGLRSRVVIEVDGKLLSGRDVAIACLLGAEEFAFATVPLIVMGCRMMRVCHLDTCPFGVATQNQKLRAKFPGKPEYVMNFMRFVAEELREIMASLGFRTIEEMVGRSDKLLISDGFNSRQDLLRFDEIIGSSEPEYNHDDLNYDFQLEDTLDLKVLLPKFKDAIQNNQHHEESVDISSINRAFGTILGSEITKSHQAYEDDSFVVNCKGGAGQSFGAFIPKGLTLNLKGDANDYLGKGLSGGKIIVSPEDGINYKPEENVIIGNVALYGATSGKTFIRGIAGERFCVRNSGATAVVEGCGDHGLEYMTGGYAVILGKTGKNFAAGMSGGIAYVYDVSHDLYKRINMDMVSMAEVSKKTDIEKLHEILVEHYQNTGSDIAKRILDDYSEALKHFKKIIPNDYQDMIDRIKELVDKGYLEEEAKLLAFEQKIIAK